MFSLVGLVGFCATPIDSGIVLRFDRVWVSFETELDGPPPACAAGTATFDAVAGDLANTCHRPPGDTARCNVDEKECHWRRSLFGGSVRVGRVVVEEIQDSKTLTGEAARLRLCDRAGWYSDLVDAEGVEEVSVVIFVGVVVGVPVNGRSGCCCCWSAGFKVMEWTWFWML